MGQQTFLGVFRKNVANFVLATCSEDPMEAFSAIHALDGESVNVVTVGVLRWFLAMANHVDYRG